jgi:hypothetical protein
MLGFTPDLIIDLILINALDLITGVTQKGFFGIKQPTF